VTALPGLAHLLVAPVLLPLATAAVLLMLGEQRHTARAALNLVSTLLGLLVAVVLLLWVDARGPASAVYLPGNWPAPFGIVVALDRFTALMLVLGAAAGLASLLFSLARWHRAGGPFHPRFQLQLAGLSGAFLTADLFNLFVFFEVLLAASYGLLLHGGGAARVRASLHYIAVNLLASLLFLVGVALLYGVTGTLNMADIAHRLPQVPAADRGLVHAGAAILAVAFLAKAAVWPLNFWLPPAYAAASAPVAGLFAMLTKVGVYAVLRLWSLCFPAAAGAATPFGADVLVWGGLATLAFGAVGMLASQQLGRLAGFSIIATSGTLLAAIGFGQPALTAAALFYLASSTLAAVALYLLVELLERSRQVETDPPVEIDAGPLPLFAEAGTTGAVNLDDQEAPLIGRAIPAALTFLGLAFVVCALVVAGLPPLSGFVGKVAMMSALLDAPVAVDASAAGDTAARWSLFGLLVVSGLLSSIALMRIGIRQFWAPQGRTAPRLRLVECAPIGLLLGACVLLVVRGEPALRYLRDAADGLHRPDRYIGSVLSAPAVRRATEGAR
jgi:multicomponent K+:H+ antiporter subunit D